MSLGDQSEPDKIEIGLPSTLKDEKGEPINTDVLSKNNDHKGHIDMDIIPVVDEKSKAYLALKPTQDLIKAAYFGSIAASAALQVTAGMPITPVINLMHS